MVKKKFTTEEKIRAVELHIREGMGYGGISDRYGVPTATLRLWIRNYQTFGVEGLMGRKSEEVIRQGVMDFVHKYGLLGLMTALPTTPQHGLRSGVSSEESIYPGRIHAYGKVSGTVLSL